MLISRYSTVASEYDKEISTELEAAVEDHLEFSYFETLLMASPYDGVPSYIKEKKIDLSADYHVSMVSTNF